MIHCRGGKDVESKEQKNKKETYTPSGNNLSKEKKVVPEDVEKSRDKTYLRAVS